MSTSPALDRASQYGDGLFTTTVVKSGEITLWEFHRQRLLSDSQRLMINIDCDQLQDDAFKQAQALANGVLKIHLSAGFGGRGYQRDETALARVTFSRHHIPSHYESWRTSGIEVDVSPVKLGLQPLLAGIKHLNRLEQVLVKQHMNFDDALVTSIDGFVIEASASNVFWYKNGTWYTPAIEQCGVEGVFRNYLIATLRAEGTSVEVSNYRLDDLLCADGLFVCNALMKIVPVTVVHHQRQTFEFDIQPVRQLQQHIMDKVADFL